MSKIWIRYWPLIFILGYTAAVLIEHTQLNIMIDNIEIHYRIFLILLFSVISAGGFLLILLPTPFSLAIVIAVLSYFLFKWK